MGSEDLVTPIGMAGGARQWAQISSSDCQKKFAQTQHFSGSINCNSVKSVRDEIGYFHCYLDWKSYVHISLTTVGSRMAILQISEQKLVYATWIRHPASQVHKKHVEWAWDRIGARDKVW